MKKKLLLVKFSLGIALIVLTALATLTSYALLELPLDGEIKIALVLVLYSIGVVFLHCASKIIQ